MSQMEPLNEPMVPPPPGGFPPPPGMPDVPPGMPGMPPVPPPQPPGGQAPTMADVNAAIGGNLDPPTMPEMPSSTVPLPAGWQKMVGGQVELVREAQVRELTGYDEEALARLDMLKNPAVYITKLLSLAVVDLGGTKPTEEIMRQLLIGDRDALLLGIRGATYGNEVDFKLTCVACETESEVYVELDKDVETVLLGDPPVWEHTVPLKRGTAKVVFLNGMAQEAYSQNLVNKTSAEISTIMLSHSVVEINGKPTFGDPEAVKALSSRDRETLLTFVTDHQPGPKLQEAIEVPCSNCGEPFRIQLGLPNLFRF